MEENLGDQAAHSATRATYSTTGNGWLHRPAIRTFCFSHAGGAAAIFRLWPAELPSWVDVWAVQFPGHGSRWREPPVRTIPALVEALIPAWLPHLSAPTIRSLAERIDSVSERRPPVTVETSDDREEILI
jgi:hypothetical protein